MDTRAAAVNGVAGSVAKADPGARADTLHHEIDQIRGDLAGMIGELDRRGHDLLNFRLQVRRHPVPLLVAGVALLTLTAGAVALGLAHRRRRARLRPRLARLQRAVERMIDKPSRVANTPGVGHKVAAAAGGALASILAKRLAGRLLAPKGAKG